MTIYFLLEPSGTRVDGVWKEREKVPQVWWDCFGTRFFTDDGDIRSEDVTEERYQKLLRDGGQDE